jgi:HK97 family phage portal protein
MSEKTTFWNGLKGLFSPEKKAERGISVGVGCTPASALNAGIDFGVPVNNNTAMKVTAFYAGIRMISENIASLPRSIRRRERTGMIETLMHPAYRVIALRPNEYTSTFAFWACIVTWMKGWGNAYALIRRDRYGNPVELHQIHPSWVEVTLVNGHKWYKVTCPDPDLDFLNGTHPDADMLHFFEVSFDGVRGVNPVIYNAAALGKSMATEKFASDFYRNGGNVRAVMESDGHMTDEEYNKFVAHFQTASGNFQTPLLEYGIKYKQLSVDPVAAQLVESETLSIQDICRILNIPPHMLAELSRATFSNIEHQTIQFVQYSLRPVIKRIEVELEAKLFFEREQGSYDVKFILDGLLRGDTAARSAYYHNAILDGYMSRNEVRELEGMPHADGLDEYLYPSNEGVVGQEPQDDNND